MPWNNQRRMPMTHDLIHHKYSGIYVRARYCDVKRESQSPANHVNFNQNAPLINCLDVVIIRNALNYSPGGGIPVQVHWYQSTRKKLLRSFCKPKCFTHHTLWHLEFSFHKLPIFHYFGSIRLEEMQSLSEFCRSGSENGARSLSMPCSINESYRSGR